MPGDGWIVPCFGTGRDMLGFERGLDIETIWKENKYREQRILSHLLLSSELTCDLSEECGCVRPA